MAGLAAALDRLNAMRAEEGGRLASVLAAQLASIETLVAQVAASPAHTPEAMRQKLKDQLTRLLGETSQLDDARLYQKRHCSRPAPMSRKNSSVSAPTSPPRAHS